MFCHSCGTQIAAGLQFCPACGQPVSGGVPASVPVFVPPAIVEARGSDWLGAGWQIVKEDMGMFALLTLVFGEPGFKAERGNRIGQMFGVHRTFGGAGAGVRTMMICWWKVIVPVSWSCGCSGLPLSPPSPPDASVSKAAIPARIIGEAPSSAGIGERA